MTDNLISYVKAGGRTTPRGNGGQGWNAQNGGGISNGGGNGMAEMQMLSQQATKLV